MSKTLLFLFSILSTAIFAQQKNNLDKNIYTILDINAENLLKKSKAYSVSIGIVKDGKVYTKHYGELDKGKDNKATNNTYFEIASVTKVMTGYLMAKAVLEKKINLEDDIRKYLNGSYPNLEYQTIPVRIKDLVSFKSALDRELPDNSEIKKIKDDSTCFRLKRLEESYSKKQFFEDLKTVKLDTIPGTKDKYSNLSLELSAIILENVYHKSYETLLNENIFIPAKMTSTKMSLGEGEVLANGYNGNHILMPHIANNLWGSEGYLKSTMADLTKLLSFELDLKNRIVQESQRNISNSNQHWFGYFWDGILATENGKFCHKHGGAFGTNTYFTVYPELNLGISIVVNIADEETGWQILTTVWDIAEDLRDKPTKKTIYGYRMTKDKVIFNYTHNKKLDGKLVKSVSVVGSFNDWNPENKGYQMVLKGNNSYQLELPKSQFEKGKINEFKFVINKVGWTTTPKNALNTDNTENGNLIFKID
jgi:CubicO group peptidase (beta-lactamase class C family)